VTADAAALEVMLRVLPATERLPFVAAPLSLTVPAGVPGWLGPIRCCCCCGDGGECRGAAGPGGDDGNAPAAASEGLIVPPVISSRRSTRSSTGAPAAKFNGSGFQV